MKEIRLTQGKVTLVDDRNFGWLNQWKWYFHHTGYAVRNQWNSVTKKRYMIFMHRLILNTPKGFEADHINQNKLDNQRSNLRIATHSQNQSNGDAYQNNTSGYKGVHWDKKAKKWDARIQVTGKRIRLGAYEKKWVAALAYNIAAIGYRGKFARLNVLGSQ